MVKVLVIWFVCGTRPCVGVLGGRGGGGGSNNSHAKREQREHALHYGCPPAPPPVLQAPSPRRFNVAANCWPETDKGTGTAWASDRNNREKKVGD